MKCCETDRRDDAAELDPPFTVVALATAPTASEWALLALMMALAGAAFVRLR